MARGAWYILEPFDPLRTLLALAAGDIVANRNLDRGFAGSAPMLAPSYLGEHVFLRVVVLCYVALLLGGLTIQRSIHGFTSLISLHPCLCEFKLLLSPLIQQFRCDPPS